MGPRPRSTTFPGYDRLDVGQIIARLPRFSQVELTAVESYRW
jgi:hypothetical protein